MPILDGKFILNLRPEDSPTHRQGKLSDVYVVVFIHSCGVNETNIKLVS